MSSRILRSGSTIPTAGPLTLHWKEDGSDEDSRPSTSSSGSFYLARIHHGSKGLRVLDWRPEGAMPTNFRVEAKPLQHSTISASNTTLLAIAGGKRRRSDGAESDDSAVRKNLRSDIAGNATLGATSRSQSVLQDADRALQPPSEAILYAGNAVVPATERAEMLKSGAIRWLEQHYAVLQTLREKPHKVDLAKLYETAASVASIEVLLQWKEVIRIWRRQGYINLLPDISSGSLQSTRTARASRSWLEGVESVWVRFAVAWDDVDASDATAFLTAVRDRYGKATLYHRYTQALATTASQCNNRRHYTKETAFQMIYGPTKSQKANPSQWNKFSDKLKHAKPWYDISNELGAGALALLPYTLSKTYIEQKLPRGLLQVWMDLVRHLNGATVDLAKAVDREYTRAMQGCGPPDQDLIIERTNQRTLEAAGNQKYWFSPVMANGTDRVQETPGYSPANTWFPQGDDWLDDLE